MVVDAGLPAIALLVGRLLFGGLLAFQGLNHFMNLEEMAGYAGSKGVPVPALAVAGSGLLLTLGGVGIILGVYPTVAATLLVVFFLIVTPTMHDFWEISDEDRQQTEMVNFLKNVELLGASLLFIALGKQPWAFALNIGL